MVLRIIAVALKCTERFIIAKGKLIRKICITEDSNHHCAYTNMRIRKYMHMQIYIYSVELCKNNGTYICILSKLYEN